MTNPQKRRLKSLAQRLDASLKVGKHGLGESFLESLNEALEHHELVKVRFDGFKDQKKELIPQMTERTNSLLIMRVGHVAVLFRRNPDPARQKMPL